MNLVGRHFGSIHLDQLLGAGGMGEVYRGYDQKLQRYVAVKAIRSDGRFSPELKARFLREARILSKLGHPGICQVYDLLESEETDLLVLEFVEGETLRDLLQRAPPFERLLQLAEGIAAALLVAHREQIVHRDLKPENIMVTSVGAVKILDFGIARTLDEPSSAASAPAASDGRADPSAQAPTYATTAANPASGATDVADAPIEGPTEITTDRPSVAAQALTSERLTLAGSVLGTRRYMSPQQAAGGEVDAATDIYALGVVLDEMFLVLDKQGTRRRDPDLALLIERMQSFEPVRRPSASAVAKQLAWIAERPLRERKRRLRRVLSGVAASVLLILLAAMTWLAYQARAARDEAERRRGQAESLVEFMLGDLREKLAGVGRLDLLAGINTRAAQYLGALAENELSPQELKFRVQSLLQVADVHLQSGAIAAANTTAEQALRMAEALVRRQPDSVAFRQLEAEALNWLGLMHIEGDEDIPAALALFRKSTAIQRAILSRAPDNADYLGKLAGASNNIGAMEFQLRNYREAQSALSEAVSLRERQLAVQPQNTGARAELASDLGWLSSTLDALGDPRAGLAMRERQIGALEALSGADPDNMIVHSDTAVALHFLAKLQERLGMTSAAQSSYREGIRHSDILWRHEPDNADWQRQRAVFRIGLSEQLLMSEDFEGAEAELLSALAAFDALLAKDATRRDWRRNRANVLRQLSRVAVRRGDMARVDAQLAEAEAILQTLLDEKADDRETQRMLAGCEYLQGLALDQQGRTDAAHTRYERAWQRMQSLLQDSRDTGLLQLGANLALVRKNAADLAALVGRLAALDYRSPGFATTCASKGYDCKAIAGALTPVPD